MTVWHMDTKRRKYVQVGKISERRAAVGLTSSGRVGRWNLGRGKLWIF